ncbi:outer kinetochore KNL1 complex subunit ZWINT isoform X7 [Patagioenas fasciata]|uniref:outer kinetochore KNL1 complex subunit ZWINT isoform X7 n=1 Tax=Patagioenas fasciata TaxID=372321 RepID=UPI003A992A56
MAGPLERARGLLGALEAALSPPGEDGDVPPQVLVEHLLDRRRKRKLLLTQLRVLQRLLQVLQCPDTPPALPDLRAAQAQARNSWRELKLGYGGALETLGGALPPTLARMGEGRRLQRRLQEAVTKHLQAQLHEALERRQQVQQRLEELRRQRDRQQGALQRLRGAELRGGAGCRLYQTLSGVGPLELREQRPLLVEQHRVSDA